MSDIEISGGNLFITVKWKGLYFYFYRDEMGLKEFGTTVATKDKLIPLNYNLDSKEDINEELLEELSRKAVKEIL